jgi:CRP-like cAMP-binding protein
MTTSDILPEATHQFSIMQRIVDGTLRIDSIGEFEEILAIYPNDPLLYRKYADLLLEKQHTIESLQAYNHASELFIQHGMNLQAIVSKILQWSIEKPTHDQGRRFHSLLHDEGSRHTPLQKFWAQMSYAELVSVMLRLVRLRIPTGKKVVLRGDPADNVFFVVSGSLMEIPSVEKERKAAEEGLDTEPILLGSNDIFGDIFPMDKDCLATTEIRTISEVELVKIEKSVLVETCKKHPNVEMLLRNMLKTNHQSVGERQWKTVRRSRRFGVPTKVEVKIGLSEEEKPTYTGIAQDLSLNGICIDFGTDSQKIANTRLKGQFVQMRLDLQNEVAVLDISGTIVWHQGLMTGKSSSVLVGIRFDSMDKEDRNLLIEYCSGSAGEQNLLWSLWHTMVRTDGTSK